jgi:hypothetical protein
MVDKAVPLLPSSPCLLPRLLDNDGTVFVILIVGPCRQDRGRGKKQPLPPMPLPPPTGGRDTLEIKEFCCRHPNCNVYVDRATRGGVTDAQGQHQGGSPVDDNNDDNGSGNNDCGGTTEMSDGVGDEFKAPLKRDEAKFGS